MRRVELTIRGRVQGVAFRAYTEREAMRLGLRGFVRNLRDGGVEVVAEGDEADLRQLVAWCQHGPPAARVDGVAENWGEGEGAFDDFAVRLS